MKLKGKEKIVQLLRKGRNLKWGKREFSKENHKINRKAKKNGEISM